MLSQDNLQPESQNFFKVIRVTFSVLIHLFLCRAILHMAYVLTPEQRSLYWWASAQNLQSQVLSSPSVIVSLQNHRKTKKQHPKPQETVQSSSSKKLEAKSPVWLEENTKIVADLWTNTRRSHHFGPLKKNLQEFQ